MSGISREEIDQIASLCRIALSDEERDSLQKNVDRLLKQMSVLEEIPTDGVEPCLSPLEGVFMRMDDDVSRPPIPREEILRNAPDQVGGMVKVPIVIQFDEES